MKVASPECPHHAEVVQRDDETGAGDVEDGMDVEVVLRRLVFGEGRLVEDGEGPQVGSDEHHVPTEVAPRTEAGQRGDASDAVRLGVVHTALGEGLDLDRTEVR
jgi:hypothetical protein